jgi:rhodanese-related sulfurtransferase
MQDVPRVTVDQLPAPLPEDISVVDVREEVEWQHGHIEGSLHVPMMQVPQRLDELPTHGQVLVVCTVGGRSAQVVNYLQHQGVDAVNLDGGLLEWHAAGRPLVSDVGDPMVV